MKNIERYKSAWIAALMTSECCDFICDHVFNGEERCESRGYNIDCEDCAKRVAEWLNEDDGVEPEQLAAGRYCNVWDDYETTEIVRKVIAYEPELGRPYVTLCEWTDADGKRHKGVATWKHAALLREEA